MTTIYIAGPMTGHPNFNREAFHDAAARLRDAGYHVISPAETPRPCFDPDWDDWIRASIKRMLDADAIAKLPGWQQSKGASLELRIASDLRMQVSTVEGWLHAMKISQKETR